MKKEDALMACRFLLIFMLMSSLITDLLLLQNRNDVEDALKNMDLLPNADCSPRNVSMQMVCAFIGFNKDATDRTISLVNGIAIPTLIVAAIAGVALLCNLEPVRTQ